MRSKNLFVSALVALSVAFALAVMARAQTPEPDAPPAPEAPAAPEKTTDDETTAAPATAAADGELRRLDDETPPAVVESPEDGKGGISVSIDTADDDESAGEDTAVVIRTSPRRGAAEGMPFGDHTVPEGSAVHELVSVLGNSTLNGESARAVVSVLGNTTVNGRSGREAVSVLGNTTVNGEVGGEAVAVLGNVVLGPKAIVHGDVVAVGGQLVREEGSVVHGSVQEINVFHGASLDWLKTWIYRCAMWGRPLAFGRDLGWAWTLAGCVFAAYVFLALLFPRAFEKCVDTLEAKPGHSLLTMLLSILLTPVLLVLLAVTGIGIILIPFLVAGVMFGSIFGKAVMHAWLGRRITRYFGSGPANHIAVATLVGSAIILLLYTVPFLGMLLWKGLGMLGLGVVIYTLIIAMRKESAADAGPVPPVVPPVASTTDAAQPNATAALPASALPRAGFWHRLLASILDVIVVGVVGGATHTGDFFLLWFSIYHVVMWALRGTTIGGIVCGLKVVRLDDGKVDWLVAIVRCLGAFLSFAVLCLGFIWVAFDKDRQSWHDKIAGTVIVRAPKGVSLL